MPHHSLRPTIADILSLMLPEVEAQTHLCDAVLLLPVVATEGRNVECAAGTVALWAYYSDVFEVNSDALEFMRASRDYSPLVRKVIESAVRLIRFVSSDVRGDNRGSIPQRLVGV